MSTQISDQLDRRINIAIWTTWKSGNWDGGPQTRNNENLCFWLKSVWDNHSRMKRYANEPSPGLVMVTIKLPLIYKTRFEVLELAAVPNLESKTMPIIDKQLLMINEGYWRKTLTSTLDNVKIPDEGGFRKWRRVHCGGGTAQKWRHKLPDHSATNIIQQMDRGGNQWLFYSSIKGVGWYICLLEVTTTHWGNVSIILQQPRLTDWSRQNANFWSCNRQFADKENFSYVSWRFAKNSTTSMGNLPNNLIPKTFELTVHQFTNSFVSLFGGFWLKFMFSTEIFGNKSL